MHEMEGLGLLLFVLVYEIKLTGRLKKKTFGVGVKRDTTAESNGLDVRQNIPGNLKGEKVTKTVTSLLADYWKVPRPQGPPLQSLPSYLPPHQLCYYLLTPAQSPPGGGASYLVLDRINSGVPFFPVGSLPSLQALPPIPGQINVVRYSERPAYKYDCPEGREWSENRQVPSPCFRLLLLLVTLFVGAGSSR